MEALKKKRQNCKKKKDKRRWRVEEEKEDEETIKREEKANLLTPGPCSLSNKLNDSGASFIPMNTLSCT